MNSLPSFILLLWLSTISAPLSAPPRKKASSIFNGKDLTGWEGMPGMWMVKDGAITPKQSTINNWVFWRGGQWPILNFAYQLPLPQRQFRSAGKNHRVRTLSVTRIPGGSGPQAKMGLWHHSKAPEKYQVNWPWRRETVYAKDGTKSINKVADPDKVKSAYKEDGWNDLVVIAKGPTVIQKINGVVFSQLTDHDEKYSLPRDGSPFRTMARAPMSNSKTSVSESINRRITSLNSNT